MSDEIERIPAGKLTVDPAVQRGLDNVKVEKMVSEFDEAALGTITVSRRKGGQLCIIDGQHRTAAARIMKGEDYAVPCLVFKGLSVEGEARMFRLLNNTTKVEPLALFRVRMVEGEEVAVAIGLIIDEAGWALADRNMNGGLRCVAAMERIYRRSPEALLGSLTAIRHAWGVDDPAGDGRIVEGIGLLIARYGTAIDVSDLAHKLAAAGTPSAFIGRARTIRDALGTTLANCIAEVAVEIYNKNRRTKALPSWRS